MLRRAVWAAGALCLAAPLCLAEGPRQDRVRITDPDRLEALGFPRDAANIFDARPAPPTDSKASTGTDQAPETWGGSTGYTTVPGFALQSESGSYGRLDRLPEYTHCTGGVYPYFPYPTFAHVPVDLPDGARIGSLRYWAYDSSPDLDLIFRVYSTCQDAPTGSPAEMTLLGEGFTIAAIGEYNSFTPLAHDTVDNQDCFYFIQVQFAPDDAWCTPHALGVRKLQVSWTRQVSPAPLTATFTDVPTTHPFFRFVEALTASGITAGCGGGNFCPDSPLTRGQMAVFLAVALGLN